MINLKNLEMFGKKIIIQNSSDKTKIGLSGLVVFETHNTISLKTTTNKIIKIKKKELLKIKEVL